MFADYRACAKAAFAYGCVRTRCLILAKLDAQAEQRGVALVPLVGGVQDRPFVAATMARQKIDTIYHAAAYKHVPLMEQNILQAIKNNTIGTLVLAEEAVRARVPSFTLISTDKAVNPTNVMGASKRLAERICQAMNAEHKVTRFSMVRLVTCWLVRICGAAVPTANRCRWPNNPDPPGCCPLFHDDWEAVQLVIQASALAVVFVLDMGVPVKIKDLAFKMVQPPGLRPYLPEDDQEGEDIAIRITGLRSGEKMYEELSYGKI